MNKTYEELTIYTNNIEFLSDFVFSFEIDAIEEKNDCIVIRSDNSLNNLIFALNELKKRLEDNNINILINHKLEIKENKDWIDEYKQSIKAIAVDNVYIHTTWQEEKEGFINIKIDPALAFGSGHHESTNSCLRLIQKYCKDINSALDVGCGSGILSLLLAKQNIKVDACDTDELAIISTKNNFLLNKLEFNDIWQGSCDKAKNKYDLVIANIIFDVIMIIKQDLINALNKNGILILSGILIQYEERIKSQFLDFILLDEIKQGDWLSLVYRKKDE